MTRIAIVHDYLTQRGGAERLVLSMVKAFPGAPVHTSLYEPASTFPEFATIDVRPMGLNRSSALRASHRRGLPLYPLAFSSLKVDADIVICSSSGFAHGVRCDGVKVVYCYTPPRWLYGEAATYMAPWPRPVAWGTAALRPLLRRWDQRAAATADGYLTSSTTVRDRIRRDYGRSATVVAPGTGIDVRGPVEPVAGLPAGFVLSVSRLLSYKNVDAVTLAFRDLPEVPLVVVGSGPESERVQSLAGANVRILPTVTDAQLRWLYANCSALVAASFEDFGLTPIEAARWGRPTAALRAGGYLDTVREGITGHFFDEPTPQHIAATVSRLLEAPLPPEPIVAHSEHYTEQAFVERFRDAVLACAGRPPSAGR